ncbi:hypothetical protein NKH69_33190 [Mesorhizobium sp. M0976]|uniref:hypothetical protein n=3 Tax=unclassified Mesorhizobium TaxID=325217 RepID=UPI003335A11D
MGMSLPDFIGDAEAKVAAKLIAAAADDGAKAVLGDVDAHKNAWAAKSNEERTTLSQSAAGWAIRPAGHRVNCPSCASQALVVGEPVTAPTQKLEDGEITETQISAQSFRVHRLRLEDQRLFAPRCGWPGERYKKTQVYDAAEYYAPQDNYEGYEDDNNER